jgi:thiazole synthase
MADQDLGELRVGKYSFGSRLILGTGKYDTMETMERALEASGTELVTVAVRRVKLDGSGPNIYDHLPRENYAILPNTAGCFDAEETMRTARLARELLDTDLLKLEVLYDQESLLPEPLETLAALDVAVKEGFTVMVYCGDDPVLAKRIEERGAAAVMPLGSSIGSGMGILNPHHIRMIVENANVPVLVDAGLGLPSHVSQAMELGAAGVIVNTAVARAEDPVAMARGMRLACEAGRWAHLARRAPPAPRGSPSSPTEGVVR